MSTSLTSLLPASIHQFLLDLNLLNPLNLFLALILSYLIYTLYPSIPILPLPSSLPSKPTSYNWRPNEHKESLIWKNYTEKELLIYDGEEINKVESGGKILFAIRRKVYDVTLGKSFYGPGGPYSIFAGKDASRGLAKQSFDEDMITKFGEPIDNLEDLTKTDWDGLKDWEDHFNNKYIMCGDYVSS